MGLTSAGFQRFPKNSLGFLRIAKAYARLGIVTQTLSHAAKQLWHFSVIFIVILSIYAEAGHILYGQDMDEYKTFATSLQSCFDILLGGGDFNRMRQTAHVGTLIFYWTLVVLGVMIGMNMIITILMEGFQQANKVMDKKAPSARECARELYDRRVGLYRSKSA